MTGLGIALVVALGSAVGCAIASPATYQEIVWLFVISNGLFFGLVSHFGLYAMKTYRSLYSPRR
jgi:hypothetical protein